MGILRTDKISGLETPTSNDFGPNLLYNGDFSKGTDGWTGATGGTISVSNGQLTVTNTAVNGRAISTAFDTVVGELYEINIHNISTTGQFRLELREGNGYGSDNSFGGSTSVAGVRTLRFVATETSHTVVVYAIGGAGTTSTYDDITVRKINKLVTGSVHFDGVDDYIEVSGGLDIQSTNDYTIEAWIFPETIDDANEGFISLGTSANNDKTFQISVHYTVSDGNQIKFAYKGNTGILYADNIEVGVWQHIAATRKNGVIRLFVDGVQKSTVTQSTPNALSSGNITIGRNRLDNKRYNGYISNFRISKTALYTENFTPPVHALEVIGDTIMLCCNNPDSVTAEATGRTITSNGNPNFVTKNPGLTRDFTSGTEFKGVTTFDTQGYFVPPSGTTEQRGRGRGIFSAGTSPNDTTSTNNIDYITIATLGNSQDFGDTTESLSAGSSGSDSTRGLFSGGLVAGNNTNYNTISYITIATTSNAVNFGDLSELKRYSGSTSDKTRTVIAGGKNNPGPTFTTIEYVTTQALGNAIDFGDLSTATWAFAGTASSPTRGIYFGGSTGGSSDSVNTIVYVTIQTLGDALDFGDLTNVNAYTGPGGIVSSSTRGIRGGGGGQDPFTRVNTIDYVTMASTGNAQDFGDLSYTANGVMGCSSLTRGIFAGGKTPAPASVNTIEYVTIASTGNAQDFGDMLGTYAFSSALSDCHGGIS